MNKQGTYRLTTEQPSQNFLIALRTFIPLTCCHVTIDECIGLCDDMLSVESGRGVIVVKVRRDAERDGSWEGVDDWRVHVAEVQ